MKAKHPPIYLAIASIFLTPVSAILMALVAVLIVLCWPLIPFLVYLKEKEKEANPEPTKG
jgi:hypothetical protein